MSGQGVALLAMLGSHWSDNAACVGHTEAFFIPDGWPRGVNFDWGPARRMCRSCPVRAECLDHAIDNYEVGYWGGETEADRVHIRRNRNLRAARETA